MKPGKITAYLILMSIVLYSCFRPDNFPDEPRIDFRSLSFSTGPNGFDTLILELDFQDGDGNIGLDERQILPPYHDFDFVIDADTVPVTFGGDHRPPFTRLTPFIDPGGRVDFASALLSENDIRPSTFDCQAYVIDSMFLSGFPVPSFPIFASCPQESGSPDCVIRDTLRNDDGQIVFDGNNNPRLVTRLDTFFIVKNDNNRNIFVDFFRKRGSEYEPVDFTTFFGCADDFDARFPIFSEDRIGKSVEGTLRYFMQSGGWQFFFAFDTFRIEARIQDGFLNQSNTVVTPDFTFQQLQSGG